MMDTEGSEKEPERPNSKRRTGSEPTFPDVSSHRRPWRVRSNPKSLKSPFKPGNINLILGLVEI